MNVIMIVGFLGKDAVKKTTQNSDIVSSFSVAESQGKNKPLIWWSCSLFGKRAELLEPYLVKGKAVTVTGVISQNTYKDKNGNECTNFNIRVNDIALQGSLHKESTELKSSTVSALSSNNFDDFDNDMPF